MRAAIERAVKRTETNSGLNLNIALNYGSRAEILRAANLAMQETLNEGKNEITAELLEKYLYTAASRD